MIPKDGTVIGRLLRTPRALFGALIVTGVVYALIGVVASAVVPTAELAGSSAPLALVVEAAGIVPPVVFSAIALIAVAMVYISMASIGLPVAECSPSTTQLLLPSPEPRPNSAGIASRPSCRSARARTWSAVYGARAGLRVPGPVACDS